MSQRVAIIGAGPAGLAAAIALRERGHTVRVFEREATVGGKCRSLMHEGHAYDLGANLTTPRYREVRALAQLLDLTLQPMHERRVVSIDASAVPSLRDSGPLARTLVRAMAQVYVALRAHTGVDHPGYAEIGPLVRKPFGEWLQMHGLSRFRDLFANLFVAYGYGVMDALPAAYALKFFDRIHFEAAIDTVLGRDVDSTLTFTAGFQELWEAAVRHYDLDVKREATVHSILRDDGVVVTWTDADGDSYEEAFDALVLACPLQDTKQFVDLCEAESRLFEQIQTYDYYVTAAVLEGVPDASTFIYPYSTQFTPAQPTVFYPPVLGSPHDVFVFYSYGDESTTVEEVRRNLVSVVEAEPFGGQVLEILHTQHWRYFPHVSSEAMTKGFFEELEGMQGRRQTLYVGELLSFPLVELAVQHAQARVSEHF